MSSNEWEENRPAEGDTVRISWAKWYTEIIGVKSTIGVFLRYASGKMIIDIGDRIVWIEGNSIDVLRLNQIRYDRTGKNKG